MSRTQLSIQGQWLNGDGTAAQGTVSLSPSVPVLNGGTLYPADPVVGLLDSQGRLISQGWQALNAWATDDAGTVPTSLLYVIGIQIDGAARQEFQTVLPGSSTAQDFAAAITAASNVVTLSNLIADGAMVGQAISGTGIPGGTTVTAFSVVANTLTLSNPASSTGTTVLTVGGAVSVTALLADAL